MKNTLALIFTLAAFAATAQINMADSSAQAVAYWTKGDKQNYTLTQEKTKIKGEDTTSKSKWSYDAVVTVVDSTAKSYTLQWECKNYKSSDTSTIYRKLMGLGKDLKIIYKTDELGAFEEVVNWKEIQAYMQKAIKSVSDEFKAIPEMDKLIKQMGAMFSTREAIESAAIKEVNQFHKFFGVKYKMGELQEGKMQSPNIFGGQPFDLKFTLSLEELDQENDTYMVKMAEEVNKAQLTNAVFTYMTNMAKTLKVDPPKIEELSELKNETVTVSSIHASGWPIASFQMITVNMDNVTSVETRLIEMK